MLRRIAVIDVLRGLVMVLMAIDHTRDFVHSAAMSFAPEDLSRTTPAIFLTRWVTHFCAPAFMFCAGLGAGLRLEAGQSRRSLSTFLVTRGLWLIVLEVTIVQFGFFFNLKYDLVFLLVFWALGVSMIALAGLIHLPYRLLIGGSVAMVVLHNLADGVAPARFGRFDWLWRVLHQNGLLRASHPAVIVGYPLIPWIAVMAIGFCCARVYRWPADRRRATLIAWGLSLTAAFVVLRALNVYGDPRPWTSQARPMLTVLSFLNCTKYPPSLLFLLMTLGPAVAFLGWLDGARPERHPLTVFGRVPLFYFVIHLPLIHAIVIVMNWLRYGPAPFVLLPPPTLGSPRQLFPSDYGWNLGVVYAVWAVVVIALFPLCRAFSQLKTRRRDWWLSYL